MLGSIARGAHPALAPASNERFIGDAPFSRSALQALRTVGRVDIPPRQMDTTMTQHNQTREQDPRQAQGNNQGQGQGNDRNDPRQGQAPGQQDQGGGRQGGKPQQEQEPRDPKRP